jgi:PEP-CTERM motif
MQTRTARSLIQLLASILCFVSIQAQALPTISIQTRVFAGNDFDGVTESAYANAADTGQARSDGVGFAGSRFPGSGGASLFGSADFGTLKAGAVSSCNGVCGAGAGVDVSFADEMRIDRVGMQGQIGILTTRLSYQWEGTNINQVDGAFASYAQSNIQLMLTGLGTIGASQFSSTNALSPARLQISDLSGSLIDVPFAFTAEVTTPFAFGTVLPFSLSLGVGTYAAGAIGPQDRQFLAYASMNARNSAYWGGMSVSLADGTVINDYELSAASGIDWRKSFVPTPVPEPGTFALLLGGLVTLFLARRRATRETLATLQSQP